MIYVLSRLTIIFVGIFVIITPVSSQSRLLRGPVHYRGVLRRQTEDYNAGGIPSNMPSPPEHPKPKNKDTQPKTTPTPLPQQPLPTRPPSTRPPNRPQTRPPTPVPAPRPPAAIIPMPPMVAIHQGFDSDYQQFIHDHDGVSDQDNEAEYYYGMDMHLEQDPYLGQSQPHYRNPAMPFDHPYPTNHISPFDFQLPQPPPPVVQAQSNNQMQPQVQAQPMATSTEASTTEKAEEEDDDEEENKEPAPFGFEETILIMVPQVKYKIHGLPKWFGASFKLSYPITIFFDELDWPKGFNKWGLPFPLPMYQQRPIPPRRRRSRSILELPPATSFPGLERATLIPQLEKTLKSSGLVGRPCLLRCVCEVHEADVRRNYGFLGEVLHQLFSISNSAYAESHLPGYLEAEMRGRAGDCSAYFEKCSRSLFEVKADHCDLGVKDC